jgi:hypothetical protein
MQEWHLVLMGAGIVISTVGITKVMLTSAVKTIKDHCGFQQKSCNQRFVDMKSNVDAAQSDVATHGHKALDCNGGKVTR